MTGITAEFLLVCHSKKRKTCMVESVGVEGQVIKAFLHLLVPPGLLCGEEGEHLG
jgi:hypothetical protein